MEWTERELQGYSVEKDVPEYRRRKAYLLQYSGLTNGFQVTKAVLQPSLLSKEMRDRVMHILIADPVASIIKFAQSEKPLQIDHSYLAEEVYERSNGEVQCIHIWQALPQSFFQEVLSNIKQKMIKELIKLENKYGCLDNLEIQSEDDPENRAFWNNIHPRIKQQTKNLYLQCFFDSAAHKAILEVETRLIELFREICPERIEPKEIGDIIGALLSDNGAYHYCDLSTQDGKNCCKGFTKLVQAFFMTYRNPLSHTNHELSKREAFELITLSSMIVSALDADIESGIMK